MWRRTHHPRGPSDRGAVRFGHLALSPQSLKTPACCSGVVDGMLGVAVAEVVLDQPQVVALVGEVVAAGVSEHVRVDARQASALRGEAYEIADGLPGERLATLGQEQPGQLVLPGGEVAPDDTQLVAGDRLLDGLVLRTEFLHLQRKLVPWKL